MYLVKSNNTWLVVGSLDTVTGGRKILWDGVPAFIVYFLKLFLFEIK